MATPERFMEPAVLTSWKEVAAYLGKGVRTVQRWEKYDGLPIRRIAGTSKIIVNREDLDHWLNAQPRSTELRISPNLALVQASVAASRQLRLRHEELWADVHIQMEQLMTECRRMQRLYTSSVAMSGKRSA